MVSMTNYGNLSVSNNADAERTLCVETPHCLLFGLEMGKIVVPLALIRFALASLYYGLDLIHYSIAIAFIFLFATIIGSLISMWLRYRLTDNRFIIFSNYKNRQLNKSLNKTQTELFYPNSELFSITNNEIKCLKYYIYTRNGAAIYFVRKARKVDMPRISAESDNSAALPRVKIFYGMQWFLTKLALPVKFLAIRNDGGIAHHVKQMTSHNCI